MARKRHEKPSADLYTARVRHGRRFLNGMHSQGMNLPVISTFSLCIVRRTVTGKEQLEALSRQPILDRKNGCTERADEPEAMSEPVHQQNKRLQFCLDV